MTEEEYVNATNLAKIRIALTTIREINPLTEEQKRLKAEAARRLARLQDKLQKVVKTS